LQFLKLPAKVSLDHTLDTKVEEVAARSWRLVSEPSAFIPLGIFVRTAGFMVWRL